MRSLISVFSQVSDFTAPALAAAISRVSDILSSHSSRPDPQVFDFTVPALAAEMTQAFDFTAPVLATQYPEFWMFHPCTRRRHIPLTRLQNDLSLGLLPRIPSFRSCNSSFVSCIISPVYRAVPLHMIVVSTHKALSPSWNRPCR